MDPCRCLSRRDFLRLGGFTVVLSAVNPSFAGPLDPGLERLRSASGTGKTLIYLFQRFGADGLNTVVPINPSEYTLYRGYRPVLAVDKNHPQLGAISTDFALHPTTNAGLFALWNRGNLAVLPDVGYPNGSRSHFDSQLYLENGTPEVRTTRDGWLNRYLQAAPASGDPLRALAFGTALPASLAGPAPTLALTDIKSLGVSTADPARNAKFLDFHAQTYAEPNPGRRYDAEIAAVAQGFIRAVQSIPPVLPAPTVAYPKGTFGSSLSQLAQLIRSDLFQIEIAEVDIGGWDTHTNQQTSVLTGRFPGLLTQLSDGIAALVADLGPARMANIVILTASEFGRSARENGDVGTDHGSAWASFVIGGGVRGGIYHGAGGWRGLANLRDNRDLEHSLDFRDVFSEILARHLGTLTPDVFPGFTRTPVGFL